MALTPAQMQEVTGRFGHIVTVTVDGGALHVIYAGMTIELIPVGGDKFLAVTGGDAVPISFNRSADGKIASLSALGQTFPRDP